MTPEQRAEAIARLRRLEERLADQHERLAMIKARQILRDKPTPRCGDVYDPDGRPDDPPCRLPAGHDGWHSDGVGGMWEA